MIFTGKNLTFWMPGDDNLYGNNVTWRPNTLDTGARKSFVDLNIQLPDSRVQTFYVYAKGIPASDNDTFFRLQIWRPVDLTAFRWQLVWQQHVQVTHAVDGLYTVSTF